MKQVAADPITQVRGSAWKRVVTSCRLAALVGLASTSSGCPSQGRQTDAVAPHSVPLILPPWVSPMRAYPHGWLQAASYNMPTCGYKDPLGQYSSDELKANLFDLAVKVNASFCLKVRRAAWRRLPPLNGLEGGCWVVWV